MWYDIGIGLCLIIMYYVACLIPKCATKKEEKKIYVVRASGARLIG